MKRRPTAVQVAKPCESVPQKPLIPLDTCEVGLEARLVWRLVRHGTVDWPGNATLQFAKSPGILWTSPHRSARKFERLRPCVGLVLNRRLISGLVRMRRRGLRQAVWGDGRIPPKRLPPGLRLPSGTRTCSCNR